MRPADPLKRVIRRSLGLAGLEVRRRPRTPTTPGKPAKPAKPAKPSNPWSPHFTLPTHVAGLLKRLEIEVVVDVGANVGQFGQRLRGAGWNGRIVSFEPVSTSFTALEAAAAGDPDWTVHRLALGRSPGSATINVMQNSAQSSFLEPTTWGRGHIPTLLRDEAEEVDVARLDAVFDRVVQPLVGPRTYLKVDTQGYDMEVVAGATGCLDSIVALQVELSVRHVYEDVPDWIESLAELRRLGFLPTGLYPVFRDDRWRVIEFDCVMTRLEQDTGASPS